ncbi:hypothetical protein [Streptomyces sp. N35]|uniref:hypothetical protein n=1 Tax=Streptomyces sp. N35 TaxID=2795730 RepID=UPI0018F7BB19|nr:hypothetical protein [Streptomyces sp. N35]
MDVTERRKNWRAAGIFTGICSGILIAVKLSEGAHSLVWAVLIFWLVSITYIVRRGYGRALLAEREIRLHGFIRRRSIPWAEISDIKKRHHTARSSSWWDLRIVCTNGRSLTVPGAFTSKDYDPKFEAKLALLREHWKQAAS